MQLLNPESLVFVSHNSVSVSPNGAGDQELHSPLPNTCDQQDFQTTYVLGGPELGMMSGIWIHMLHMKLVIG